MPAHIRPSLQWFACEHRPTFNGLVYPGTASRTSQGPPRAQSPFARSQVLPRSAWCLRHHVRGIYPSFIAHTGSCARPKPSHCLDFTLDQWVFVTPWRDCQSLLGVGPSRHYLCNPCVGAWTPTPQRPSGALARFFPEGNGLTSNVTRSAH